MGIYDAPEHCVATENCTCRRALSSFWNPLDGVIFRGKNCAAERSCPDQTSAAVFWATEPGMLPPVLDWLTKIPSIATVSDQHSLSGGQRHVNEHASTHSAHKAGPSCATHSATVASDRQSVKAFTKARRATPVQALESERAKVADLQRQIADLEEVARLKAGTASAAPPAAGRRSRAPQRMRQYTPAPASPAPQPTVHSAQDSSGVPPAAPGVASEASNRSAAGDGAAPAAPVPVDLVPHGTALGAGASTPPWQPMPAPAAAGTGQSHAVHMHAIVDASGPSATAVAASLADMQGPGAPEAELSLIEASGRHKVQSDPYSHLSLLTPPGPLLPDSSESQRSQSGSSWHAAASPLQLSVVAPGDAAAAGGAERPNGFGRRSPQGDTPEAVEGPGSAGLSRPDVPQPGTTLSPVASGVGGTGPHGARRLSRRTTEDVLDSTSQWGVTGMGSLENVIDFLGTAEQGQAYNSVDLSPTDGRDCAQSATPAAAVYQ